ncbi:hypothetical protein [Achromobacter denitrificans]|uniref:hypothetical protein n=1 Tax=Achromobacter denitrificans TaxID=32002 RepID=UPI0016399FE0|nr:hypothetical protein [Achromobacter denitrificans]
MIPAYFVISVPMNALKSGGDLYEMASPCGLDEKYVYETLGPRLRTLVKNLEYRIGIL